MLVVGEGVCDSIDRVDRLRWGGFLEMGELGVEFATRVEEGVMLLEGEGVEMLKGMLGELGGWLRGGEMVGGELEVMLFGEAGEVGDGVRLEGDAEGVERGVAEIRRGLWVVRRMRSVGCIGRQGVGVKTIGRVGGGWRGRGRGCARRGTMFWPRIRVHGR